MPSEPSHADAFDANPEPDVLRGWDVVAQLGPPGAIDPWDAQVAWCELAPGDELSPARERLSLLCEVARRFDYDPETLELTLDQAQQHVPVSGPLATCIPGTSAWLICRAVRGRRFRISTSLATQSDVTREGLAELLQAPFDAPLPWVKLPRNRRETAAHAQAFGQATGGEHERASPLHEDGAAGHHDHGSHGHAHPHPQTRLWRLLRPELRDIWVVTLFAAVISVLSLATPVAVEALVNNIAFGRMVQPIFVLGGILFVFLGFASALRLLQTWITEIVQQRLFVRVVADLAHRLPRVSQDALDRQNGRELLNRFFDVMTVQKSAAVLVLDGGSVVLQTIVGMAVLASYHTYLLGFDIVLLALLSLLVFVLGRGAVRTAIEESKAKYAVAAWLEELAQFNIAAKASGGPERAIGVANQLALDYVRARRRHFSVLVRQNAFALGLQAVAGSVLLGLGGYLVITGTLTLGQLVAAELIVAVLVGSFAKLGKHFESYYDLLAAVDKLGYLFDLPMESQRGGRPRVAERAASVSVRDVHYEFEHVDVLRGLSFEAAPHEFVAITGPPGCGKTTLLDLLYGLRTPVRGGVDFDGQSIRDLQRIALRRHVALIRGLEIFEASVVENVSLNREGVTRNHVREALHAVGLWDDVEALPQGLDTPLLHSGAPLSENAARRLMLARALVDKPRLLLVDSLLDALPDDDLPRALECLRAARAYSTVLLATGREDIAQGCPRRVVLAPPPPAAAAAGSPAAAAVS